MQKNYFGQYVYLKTVRQVYMLIRGIFLCGIQVE